MTDAPDRASGWTLKDAIHRLVPSSVILQWENDKRELAQFSGSSGTGWLHGGRDGMDADHAWRQRRARAESALDQSGRKVLEALKALGSRGEIIARGRPKTPEALPEWIDADRWDGFSGMDYDRGNVFNDAASFWSVRIFPRLEAPNASATVAGWSIDNILDEFVLRDPEIKALRNAANDAGAMGLCDIIGKARDGGYLLPISDSPRTLEGALRSLLNTSPPDERQVSDELFAALASRLAALGRLMIGNKVSVHAINDDDTRKALTAIPAVDLHNPDFLLCLASGNIWLEQDGKRRRQFHRVRIEAPECEPTRPPLVESPSEGEAKPSKKNGRPEDANWKSAFDTVMARAISDSDMPTSLGEMAKRIASEAERQGTKNRQEAKTSLEGLASLYLKANYPSIRGILKLNRSKLAP